MFLWIGLNNILITTEQTVFKLSFYFSHLFILIGVCMEYFTNKAIAARIVFRGNWAHKSNVYIFTHCTVYGLHCFYQVKLEGVCS